MHTLFDSPTANRPTALDQAGPVPPVEAVLFDFANTIFRMIDVTEWLRRVALDADRGRRPEPGLPRPSPPIEHRGYDSAVVEALAAAYRLESVIAAQAGRDVDAVLHRRAMCAWFAEVELLRGIEDLAYDRMIAGDSWVPYPDTAPVLRELRERGIPFGVVSDIAWDVSVHFTAAGIADLPDAFVLSYQIGREKPDPQMFLKACADLGADPRRTLMVGDNPVRDGGATAVGIRAFILPAEHRTGERGLRQALALLDN